MDSHRSPQVDSHRLAHSRVAAKSILSTVFVLIFFSVVARPQSVRVEESSTVDEGGFIFGSVEVELPMGRPNAPYSALKETETIQTLSDGAHITHKSHMHFYRDSQGRARAEVFIDAPSPWESAEPMQIIINDPVEGVSYSLKPSDHTGARDPFLLSPPNPAQPPQPPKPPASAAAPPLVPEGAVPKQDERQTKHEDLGTQVIEGVLAHGKRTTTAIPVNAEGMIVRLLLSMRNGFPRNCRLTYSVNAWTLFTVRQPSG